MRFEVEIESGGQMLMHNARQLSDPLDPLTKQMKAISGKRKKTDEDHEDMARLEFQGSLYLDSKGPYIPGENLETMIRDAAKITKQGATVTRALVVLDSKSYLDYDGPTDLEGLWDGKFYDRRPVTVTTSKVIRTRPMFTDWSLTFQVEIQSDLLDPGDFKAIMERAGRITGLGDYRPRFGRFDVVRITEI